MTYNNKVLNQQEFDNFVYARNGLKVGIGECGSLTSALMLVLTNGRVQFAGEQGTNARLPINCPTNSDLTAWQVGSQSNWVAEGFKVIPNPTATHLKPGDIFFISPQRSGIPTGHTGIVYSSNNGKVVTFEQNYNGIRVATLYPEKNSWTYFGGFDIVIRPADNTAPKPDPVNPNEGDEDMLRSIRDEKGNIYVFNMNTMSKMEHLSPKEWSVIQRVLKQKDIATPVQLNQAEVSAVVEMFKTSVDNKHII